MSLESPDLARRAFGRYTLYDEIASGGMAAVHLGRLTGDAGFARTVAIKRMHAQFAKDPDFVAMFLDEARLAARIRHPNVIPTLDVVATDGEILLVMDYVEGESLSRLMRASSGEGPALPPRMASAILVNVLTGLHAAHEAKDERGAPLQLIHRDVSPQNVMVGVDGVARIFDFGVAKAATRLQQTRDGKVKGKLSYMAPEQLRGRAMTRQADIYSAAVVLWEALVGRHLFRGESEGEVVEQVLLGAVPPPSRFARELPSAMDDVVLRGVAADPVQRFATAEEMAAAVARAVAPATPNEVTRWVKGLAGERLVERGRRVSEIESASSQLAPAPAAAEPPPQQTRWEGRSVARRLSPRRLGAIGAALVALSAGAAAWEVWQGRRAAPASAPPPVAGPPPSPATEVEAAAPVDPQPPVPPPAAEPSPRAKAARPSHPAASARRGCNPPYVRDANGRIHFKPECL
jgi:serine/threonine-protein kinase